MAIPGISLAARAYQTSKTLGGANATSGGVTTEISSAARPTFEDFIKDSAKDAMQTVRHADDMAVKGVQGKASTQQVVQAVMSAELTLQAVVAVRDRMVNAYQELMRMPI
jgi:flagellar hook-basal body complex protein FliE